uniref:HMA domain-containing protein n=1 Tax=Rhizophora mucronata TaxID=61149 RepID=A0A2P2LSD6_RHIMU
MDMQLTHVAGRRRPHPAVVNGDESDDMEDVRLLDSYEDKDDSHVIAIDGEEGMRRIQVRVSGMTCAACSNSVESALKAIGGVLRASVALLQNKADVVFDPNLVKDDDIKNAIEDAGFEAEFLAEPSVCKTKPNRALLGQFTIGGMTCAACVNSVERILRNLPGVKRAVVALATSLGEVEYDPTVIGKDDIVNAIEDAGFEASLVQSNQQDKIILGVAGVFNEMDAQLLEKLLVTLRGVRQFCYNRVSSELEVLFDPEVISSRSLVDGIKGGSNQKFKLHVRNPFMRMTSKDVEETSSTFRLFISSLVLSVSSFLFHAYDLDIFSIFFIYFFLLSQANK